MELGGEPWEAAHASNALRAVRRASGSSLASACSVSSGNFEPSSEVDSLNYLTQCRTDFLIDFPLKSVRDKA